MSRHLSSHALLWASVLLLGVVSCRSSCRKLGIKKKSAPKPRAIAQTQSFLALDKSIQAAHVAKRSFPECGVLWSRLLLSHLTVGEPVRVALRWLPRTKAAVEAPAKAKKQRKSKKERATKERKKVNSSPQVLLDAAVHSWRIRVWRWQANSTKKTLFRELSLQPDGLNSALHECTPSAKQTWVLSLMEQRLIVDCGAKQEAMALRYQNDARFLLEQTGRYAVQIEGRWVWGGQSAEWLWRSGLHVFHLYDRDRLKSVASLREITRRVVVEQIQGATGQNHFLGRAFEAPGGVRLLWLEAQFDRGWPWRRFALRLQPDGVVLSRRRIGVSRRRFVAKPRHLPSGSGVSLAWFSWWDDVAK